MKRLTSTLLAAAAALTLTMASVATAQQVPPAGSTYSVTALKPYAWNTFDWVEQFPVNASYATDVANHVAAVRAAHRTLGTGHVVLRLFSARGLGSPVQSLFDQVWNWNGSAWVRVR